MKHFRIVRASGLAILAACISAALHGAAVADVIEVPSAAAPSIQAGIELANDGDTVLVSPGTYYEAIDFLGKTIVVESVAGPERTIIDATGLQTNVVRVTSGEGMGTALRGFTITGGVEGGSPFSDAGGGIMIHSSRMLIDHCIIAENHLDVRNATSAGGGVYVGASPHVEISNSTIRNNSAVLGGGLVVVQSNAILTNTSFINNTGTHGGGIDLNNYANVTATDCRFEGNTSESGGGVSVLSNANATFYDCDFYNNSSLGNGGGISSFGHTYIDNCLFQENVSSRGGGIRQSSVGTTHTSLTIIDSQFIGNIATGKSNGGGGGGLAMLTSSGTLAMSGTSFIGNKSLAGKSSSAFGGGALIQGSAFVADCIFEDNFTDTNGGGLAVSGSSSITITVSESLFRNNHAELDGGGAYTTSPIQIVVRDSLLENNTAGERGGAIATTGSPLIEHSTLTGNVAGLSGGAVHNSHWWGARLYTILACDNLPENISGSYTDHGENELLEECPTPQTPGDLNGDGIVDVADLLILLSAWGACVGDCPADLNGDGVVDVADMLILLANWG